MGEYGDYEEGGGFWGILGILGDSVGFWWILVDSGDSGGGWGGFWKDSGGFWGFWWILGGIWGIWGGWEEGAADRDHHGVKTGTLGHQKL